MPLSQYDRDLYAQADPPYRTERAPFCAYCCDALTTAHLEDDAVPQGFCSADCQAMQETEDRALDPRSAHADPDHDALDLDDQPY
jgi:hypothetical protein